MPVLALATAIDETEHQADLEARCAALVEYALGVVRVAVQTAMVPVSAGLPALALELLVDSRWNAARLADRLFGPGTDQTMLATLRRQAEAAVSVGRRRGCLNWQVPPAPRELAAGVMAAVSERRLTLLVAARGQQLADRYWQKAVGTLWPSQWPAPLRKACKPALQRLTWTQLALQPAGLDAAAAARRAADEVAAQLQGLVTVWALRLQNSLEEAVMAAVYGRS